jgi:hypothetical protein
MTPTWQTNDGQIQLYLGDCLQILPQLEEGSAIRYFWGMVRHKRKESANV